MMHDRGGGAAEVPSDDVGGQVTQLDASGVRQRLVPRGFVGCGAAL